MGSSNMLVTTAALRRILSTVQFYGTLPSVPYVSLHQASNRNMYCDALFFYIAAFTFATISGVCSIPKKSAILVMCSSGCCSIPSYVMNMTCSGSALAASHHSNTWLNHDPFAHLHAPRSISTCGETVESPERVRMEAPFYMLVGEVLPFVCIRS